MAFYPSFHDPDLITYILKKTEWSQPTFNSVDWKNHAKAFSRKNKNRQKKCTLAKIVHGQCNTNMQNHFYFIAVLHCALYVTKRRRLFSMSLVVINPLLLLIGMISFAPLSIHCMI